MTLQGLTHPEKALSGEGSAAINFLEWLVAGIIIGLFYFCPPAAAAPQPEQLIVFVQTNGSAVDSSFQKRLLPPIRQLAEKMGIEVRVVDARKGAPDEVTLTPLLVYQNHRGRSIYQGRTNTGQRLKNFIRTSRFVPQGDAPYRRVNIAIWQVGRQRIWAPLKVSAVTGIPPVGYDNDDFLQKAMQQIARGFEKFGLQNSAELRRADRGFYMDFYPWRAKDGTLYLSLALYSQFDCKKPIFTDKIVGPWKQYPKLFRQAARTMEKKVATITRNPESSDSFNPVPHSTPVATWEQLGLTLPPAPKTAAIKTPVSGKIPTEWVLAEPAADAPPMILFRFPAPLDNYRGEVTTGKGQFILPEHLKVNGASGYIEVDTRKSITMGDPVLDEAILGSVMLYAKKFPTAKFVVDRITGEDQPIAYGRLTPAAVSGTFTLKGHSIPLTSRIELEPVIGDDGQPRLIVQGNFKIDLTVFDIEGADGPLPARNTLLFDVHFILQETQ